MLESSRCEIMSEYEYDQTFQNTALLFHLLLHFKEDFLLVLIANMTFSRSKDVIRHFKFIFVQNRDRPTPQKRNEKKKEELPGLRRRMDKKVSTERERLGKRTVPKIAEIITCYGSAFWEGPSPLCWLKEITFSSSVSSVSRWEISIFLLPKIAQIEMCA